MSAVWKNKKQLQFGQSDIVLTLTSLIKRYFHLRDDIVQSGRSECCALDNFEQIQR